MPAPPPLHDLAAVVHVHSTFSDGTATVPEIVEAARRSDTDVVLLTDHDSLAARRRGLEGWHGPVLLLVGHEVSPKIGHFLAFGLDEEIDHRGRSEAEICAAVRRAGGLGFPAHPFSEGSRLARRIGRPHPWADLDGCEPTGIELWSVLTDAAEACTSVRELAAFVRRPERALRHPPAGSLPTWDRLCERRRVVGIGGLDAHQTGVRLAGRSLSPFANERIFRFLRTHVLVERPPTGELDEDAAQVYDALREGRCYLAVDLLAPSRGFAFWAEDGAATLPMGAEAAPAGWTLHARLPRPADLTLVHDGRPVRRVRGDALEHRTEGAGGVYRVEGRLRARGAERTWILSNPVYLRQAP